ncbi:MAG: SLATT domain-containing protein [Frankiaceae bacterium]|nr:SLATT domain-containing protein [Frankiaceae bacterium]MBV9369404.1 SLATT domain-containing protein [Frankiales bacterium]
MSQAEDPLLGAVNRLRLRAHRSARAQYLAAKRLELANARVGVPTIILTTLVGTALFASLDGNPNHSIRLAAAIVSVVAAVLAALQTFFSFSARAAVHRQSAAKYAALKRNLDMLRLRLMVGEMADVQDQLQQLVEVFNDIEAEAPDVDDRLYDKARREQLADAEGV